MILAKFIYLDVCVLSRPFDDQSQMRIQLETNAVNLILSHVRQNVLTLTVSPVHEAEIQAIPEQEERTQLLLLIRTLGKISEIDLQAARKRAAYFTQQGVGIADAAHVAFVAFAEQAKADFISVDDRLIKKCRNLSLAIWFGSPVAYCDKENLK
mgnify:CR=1 FL=1